MTNCHHSVKTNETLARRFEQVLQKTGDSKSEVLRRSMKDYIESHAVGSATALESQIEQLREEREEVEQERDGVEARLTSIDNRIESLKEQLEDLRADGSYDELMVEMIEFYEDGADLRAIEENTGQLSKLMRLGAHNSVEEVIEYIETNSGKGETHDTEQV